MRDIGLEDVFAWSEIIDKLKLTDKIAKIQEDSVGKKDPTSYAGVQFMALIFVNIYKVKKEVISWLAGITNKSKEEVSKMSFKEMKGYITIFMQNEEFTELFSSLVSKEQN